jgi:hypothetical protein
VATTRDTASLIGRKYRTERFYQVNRVNSRCAASAAMRNRCELTPEQIELIDGKLFWSDEDRLTMLALLLENVGTDVAVRLGHPEVWRAAVAGLDDQSQ